MFFELESVSNGDRLNNRFHFECFDVGKIEIFKSAVPHHSNPDQCLMSIKRGNRWNFKWFNDFIEIFGSASHDMTPEAFMDDNFIFAWNLSPNPVLPEEKLVTERASDRQLSLIDAGSLDVSLLFNTPLPDNVCVHFMAFIDGISEFTADGIIKMYN